MLILVINFEQNVLYPCKMLKILETGSGVYRDSLYYLHNTSANLKLFEKEFILKNNEVHTLKKLV